METAVKTEMKTVREYLELFANAQHVDVSQVNDDIMNVRCSSVAWATTNKGLLQGYCSGLCIVSFIPARITLRPIYLVMDDSGERAWHSELSERVAKGDTSLHGSCPHAVLRLVQSA